MAENVRDVPERYGAVQQVHHPRIHSYGRRLLAVVPTSLVVAVLVPMLVYRRPPAVVLIVAGLLILGCLIIIYSFLRPAVAVLTQTHVLQGRMVGWKAVPRERIAQTVFAQRLRPHSEEKTGGSPWGRLRNRGVPALWFLDAKGRTVLRFDGRVWDAKTLERMSGQVTPSTIRYEQVTADHAAAAHPGMLSYAERHPRFRSVALTVLTVAVVVVIVMLNAVPEWLDHLIEGA